MPASFCVFRDLLMGELPQVRRAADKKSEFSLQTSVRPGGTSDLFTGISPADSLAEIEPDAQNHS
jgi:hypothetical protein